MPKKTSSVESVLSLDHVDVAEYSEYEFKCNFWDVWQWVTRSVIGIPRVAMIFPDPLRLLECSVCKVFVSMLDCLALKFTDMSVLLDMSVLYRGWYTLKFYDKSNKWVSRK